jgi:hypothetical protein
MTRWTFFIVALALIACGSPQDSADATKQSSSEIASADADTRTVGVLRSSEGARVRAGKRTAEVLVSPEMAQLYRVANPFEEEPEAFRKLTKSRALIAGYPIMGEIKLDRKSALTLGTLLLQSQTYVAPGQELTCLFKAGYVVRFHRGDSHVDAVICFSCSDVLVQPSADLQEKGFTDSFYGTAGGKKLYRTITELFPPSETRPAA